MLGNRQKRGRKPLTTSELLPLPSARVRAMSLENHLAFAVVKSGAGSHNQVSCLLRVVYLAWFLREVSSFSDDIELFRQGERALEGCIERSVSSKEWTLDESVQDTIGKLLSLHDAQLAAVPGHLYARAWERLQAFLKSGHRSVLDD
jgi:hypothetical protein